MTKYFSLLSIIIGLSNLALKAWVDLDSFKELRDVFSEKVVSPMAIASGLHIDALGIVFLLLALSLSILGFYKDNRFKIIGLVVNLIAVVYVFIPLGVLIATLY